MNALATPINNCFSNDSTKGAYYHEYNEIPHTCHKYDADGFCIVGSTMDISNLKDDDYYVSDRFGNKIITQDDEKPSFFNVVEYWGK